MESEKEIREEFLSPADLSITQIKPSVLKFLFNAQIP